MLLGRQAIMDAKRRIYSKPIYITYHTNTNTFSHRVAENNHRGARAVRSLETAP